MRLAYHAIKSAKLGYDKPQTSVRKKPELPLLLVVLKVFLLQGPVLSFEN